MSPLERRVPLLLDEDRYRKIAREANRRGVSVAAVIRGAIDRLPDPVASRHDAIEEILAAPPMPVPADPSSLTAELDDARAE